MKGPHDYISDCQCYKCKGIRNAPAKFVPTKRVRKPRAQYASHEAQHARYIDCGPSAWDDR